MLSLVSYPPLDTGRETQYWRAWCLDTPLAESLPCVPRRHTYPRPNSLSRILIESSRFHTTGPYVPCLPSQFRWIRSSMVCPGVWRPGDFNLDRRGAKLCCGYPYTRYGFVWRVSLSSDVLGRVFVGQSCWNLKTDIHPQRAEILWRCRQLFPWLLFLSLQLQASSHKLNSVDLLAWWGAHCSQ